MGREDLLDADFFFSMQKHISYPLGWMGWGRGRETYHLRFTLIGMWEGESKGPHDLNESNIILVFSWDHNCV